MTTPLTRRVRARTFATLLATGLLGCGDIDGNIHKCHITYNSYWDDTDLELHHWDPRTCPIPVASHEGFADLVDFAATVIDPNFDDVKDFAHLTIVNSVGLTIDEEIEPFNSQAGDGVAEPTVTYRAATGTLYGSTNPDDQGTVSVPLADNIRTALADIFLEVLFGQRNTSVMMADVLPPSDYCTLVASSTLDGQPRSGMIHGWHLTQYPSGEFMAESTGDNFTPSLYQEGWYRVELTGTDQYGYQTFGSKIFQVSSEAPGC